MPDLDIYNHTDVNDDKNTDLPESPAQMMNSQTNHDQSYFKPLARPMRYPDIVNHTDELK